MRRACDSIIAGDYMLAMEDLTPEAMQEAMSLAAGLTSIPQPTSYSLEPEDAVLGEQRFRVRFRAAGEELVAWAAWRRVDGAWKITAIGRVS